MDSIKEFFNSLFGGLFEGSEIVLPILIGLAIVLILVLLIVIIKRGRKKRGYDYQYNEQLSRMTTEESAYRPLPQDDPATSRLSATGYPDDPAASENCGTAESVDDTAADEPFPEETQPISPQTAEPVEEEVQYPVIVLAGIGGYFDRQMIEQEGSVIIGRDPRRCTLVYPKTEKGISGVHCRVQIEDSMVLLTDLGSQYGTFVNGQRLQPNSPFVLQKGDTFWLADRINAFYIP